MECHTKDDITMIDFLIEAQIPFVVVLTKADKLSKKERVEMRKKIEDALNLEGCYIEFSAETGEGVEEIQKIFEQIATQQ